MAEENKKTIEKENKVVKENKSTDKVETPVKQEEKLEDKKQENPEKKPKVEAQKKVKKEEAIAKGISLHASKKHCMYLCSFVKNKSVDSAISDLESVLKYKKAVPFKGEIPHRKGKGMMSGRYPQNASKLFIKLLKGLKGNILVNGLDLDKTKIVEASASWASRPLRSDSRQAKRTHVTLKAKEVSQEKNK